MGAGAISLKPASTEENEALDREMKALLADRAKMDQMFKDIALSADEERINIKNKISIINLLHYHKSKKSPFFSSLIADTMVLLEAHRFACGKKERKKENPLLGRERFKNLILCIYYFSFIWKVFKKMDCIVPDSKIHKGEFMRINRVILDGLDGVQFELTHTSVEDIEKEFKELDKDNSGSLTFNEFCEYAIEKIGTAEMFAAANDEEDDDETPERVDDGDIEEELHAFNVKRGHFSAAIRKPVFTSALEAVLAMELEQVERRLSTVCDKVVRATVTFVIHNF
jgi:hypothetical protein